MLLCVVCRRCCSFFVVAVDEVCWLSLLFAFVWLFAVVTCRRCALFVVIVDCVCGVVWLLWVWCCSC